MKFAFALLFLLTACGGPAQLPIQEHYKSIIKYTHKLEIRYHYIEDQQFKFETVELSEEQKQELLSLLEFEESESDIYVVLSINEHSIMAYSKPNVVEIKIKNSESLGTYFGGDHFLTPQSSTKMQSFLEKLSPLSSSHQRI